MEYCNSARVSTEYGIRCNMQFHEWALGTVVTSVKILVYTGYARLSKFNLSSQAHSKVSQVDLRLGRYRQWSPSGQRYPQVSPNMRVLCP